MKIHLISIGNPRVCEGMEELLGISEPRLHELCDDPDEADLIIVAGHWDGTNGQPSSALIRHPTIRRLPGKCFAYSEDDRYLPLLPGIYTSATDSLSARLGRVRNYCYISRWRQEREHAISRMVRPKKLLFSFLGAPTAEVRTRLYDARFTRENVLVEDTSYYSHYGTDATSEEQRSAARVRYAETIAESHFVLCPRGGGRGSQRFFETMEMGVCPVLIADDFLLPYGPDWQTFLVVVPENKISKLEQILAPLASESGVRGELANQAWRSCFAPQLAFNQIVEHCVAIRGGSRVKERYFRLLWPWMQFTHVVYYGMKKLEKMSRKLVGR